MKKERDYRVNRYALLLSVALIAANAYFIGYVEMLWHVTHMTILAAPMNVIFALLILTWSNYFFRAFNRRDLLVIYSMLAVGSAFSGHDCLPRLMGLMPYAFRFATPENDWKALLFPYLPRWLLVDDPKAVRNFYEGGVNFFSEGYLFSWLTPILIWTVIVFLLLFIFLCLTAILRRQWVQSERLSYPIVQIPLEITSPFSPIWRSRMFWIGFCIAASIDLINGLHFYYPILPEIPVRRYNLANYFTRKPFNAIGSTPLRFQPYLIGLGFLIPLDLSFSVTFFYLFQKFQRVFGSMSGMSSVPGYPFLGEQGTGALFALLLVAFWRGRHHLKAVFKGVIHPNRWEGEEPIRYRTAVFGLVLSVSALAFILGKAGMSLWVFVAYLFIYLSIATGVARMRAELGPPLHAIGYVTPQYMMISIFGTKRLRPNNLTMLSIMNWLSGASYASFRTHPMPFQLEAFKIAERARIESRTMFRVLLLACATGIISSLVLYPFLIYREGVAAASEQIIAGGADTYNFLSSWLTAPRTPDWRAISVMIAAFSASLGIYSIRARFIWFPLHPAGYVIGVAPGTTDAYWFTLLITTLIKWMLLKHGGIKAYRRAIPFFVGLVLGETVVGTFWALLGLALRIPIYSWF
jgi:hypothetical protein